MTLTCGFLTFSTRPSPMDPHHVTTPRDYTTLSHHVLCGGSCTVFILTEEEEEEEEACEENMREVIIHISTCSTSPWKQASSYRGWNLYHSFCFLFSSKDSSYKMIHKHTCTKQTNIKLAKLFLQ